MKDMIVVYIHNEQFSIYMKLCTTKGLEMCPRSEAAALGAAATLLPGDEAFEGATGGVATPFVDSIASGAQPLGGWSLCAREVILREAREAFSQGGRCNCVGTVALHSVSDALRLGLQHPRLADWAMLRHVNGPSLISL